MFPCFPGFSGQSQTRLWPVTWRKQRRGRWSRLWPLQSPPKHPIRERRLGRLEHQDLGEEWRVMLLVTFFCFFCFSKIRDDFLIVMDCVYLCTCKVPPSTVSTGEASVVWMALVSETLQLWNEPCSWKIVFTEVEVRFEWGHSCGSPISWCLKS